jgi:hypothetical protein
MRRYLLHFTALALLLAAFAATAEANLLVDPSLATATHDSTTIPSPWVFTFNTPDGTNPSGRFRNDAWANHDAGPSHGLWSNSFEGNQMPNDPPANFTLSQQVGPGSVSLGSVVTDLNPLNANDNTWRQYTVSGPAPPGTTGARAFAQMVDGRDALANPQSAFLDDFDLTETAGTYTLSVWFKEETNYTSAATNLGIEFLGVPEPSTFAIAGAGLLMALRIRRKP